jgi:hypothetical protein
MSKDAAAMSKDGAPMSKDVAAMSKDAAPLSKDAAPLSKDGEAMSKDAAPLSKDNGSICMRKEIKCSLCDAIGRHGGGGGQTVRPTGALIRPYGKYTKIRQYAPFIMETALKHDFALFM